MKRAPPPPLALLAVCTDGSIQLRTLRASSLGHCAAAADAGRAPPPAGEARTWLRHQGQVIRACPVSTTAPLPIMAGAHDARRAVRCDRSRETRAPRAASVHLPPRSARKSASTTSANSPETDLVTPMVLPPSLPRPRRLRPRPPPRPPSSTSPVAAAHGARSSSRRRSDTRSLSAVPQGTSPICRRRPRAMALVSARPTSVTRRRPRSARFRRAPL